MKHLLIMPAIVGSLLFGVVSQAEAAPRIYRSAQGLGVLIDQCFVQFDQNGKLLSGGQKCDDVQLHEAKQAVRDYLQQHGGSASSSKPRIYLSGQGPGVMIGECFAQFDRNGNLLQGGQKCDDIQLNQAREAVRNYLGN